MAAKQNSRTNIGAILLAAGSSSRLGRPKQLLLYNGRTLVTHCLQEAGKSNLAPIVLILGANANEVQTNLNDIDVQAVINSDWEEGMASSIRCGIETLLAADPSVEAAVIMMCDQPFVTASLLNSLIDSHRAGRKPVITCSYANTYGPPTLFHKSVFPELLQLKGDTGARSIVKRHASEVEVLVFPEGEIDVDTEDDYEKLVKGNNVL